MFPYVAKNACVVVRHYFEEHDIVFSVYKSYRILEVEDNLIWVPNSGFVFGFRILYRIACNDSIFILKQLLKKNYQYEMGKRGNSNRHADLYARDCWSILVMNERIVLLPVCVLAIGVENIPIVIPLECNEVMKILD